jgi:hypothetical protein
VLAAALAAPLCATAALGDAIPMPQTDYAAVLKFADMPDPVTVRFHEGMFRLEFETDGRKQALLIDPKAQLATVPEEIDGKKVATEMPAGSFNIPTPGKDIGATKVGTDQVDGATCDLWRRPLPGIDTVSEACIAEDGIWLRVTRPDYKAPVYVATKVERTAQDPALFVVPADYEKGEPTDTP